MRNGLLWFRNDLRLHDHEPLYEAAARCDSLLPVYIFDSHWFQKTHFGFPKTGAHRTRFLLESVRSLRESLEERGSSLVVNTGDSSRLIKALCEEHRITDLYFYEEEAPEEDRIERDVLSEIEEFGIKTHRYWGMTLYHRDDIPYDSIYELPDIYTHFRKDIEKRSSIREPFEVPSRLPALPPGADSSVGLLPSWKELCDAPFPETGGGVLHFKGGEKAALERVNHYFWEKDCLKEYKETRNGLLGCDYSSKFSPWLALGCISPRWIYGEVIRYERERTKNKSTYWLIFELIWRDFFRFVLLKYGWKVFRAGGIKGRNTGDRIKDDLFELWKAGRTGYPFIDANMKEISETGFMSNRGRQNVASFLVKDMQIDWRLGAEYFESQLIDYDVASNWGNWNYVSGLGNDPRENRYFHILNQAERYDGDGHYVYQWLPELKKLPKNCVHTPWLCDQGLAGYPDPCVKIRSFPEKR